MAKRTMQGGHDKMPLLKQNKVIKNLGSMDRKRLLVKQNGAQVASTLSQSPSQMTTTQ